MPSFEFDKGKTAGGFTVAIEAHDDATETAGFGEELVDLFLGGVEGEVTDVERGALGHVMNELVHTALKRKKRYYELNIISNQVYFVFAINVTGGLG